MSWKTCVECVSEGQLIRRAGSLHANFSQISKEVENAGSGEASITALPPFTARNYGRARSLASRSRRTSSAVSAASRSSRSFCRVASIATQRSQSARRRSSRSRFSFSIRLSVTYDNGKEFASHAQIATSLGALSYFAKPYHSWERGLNEHTNGLFRQYFPKGSDLSILSDADVQRVEDKLNSRPRKILGYQTPREIFFSARNLPVALHR